VDRQGYPFRDTVTTSVVMAAQAIWRRHLVRGMLLEESGGDAMATNASLKARPLIMSNDEGALVIKEVRIRLTAVNMAAFDGCGSGLPSPDR